MQINSAIKRCDGDATSNPLNAASSVGVRETLILNLATIIHKLSTPAREAIRPATYNIVCARRRRTRLTEIKKGGRYVCSTINTYKRLSAACWRRCFTITNCSHEIQPCLKTSSVFLSIISDRIYSKEEILIMSPEAIAPVLRVMIVTTTGAL